LARRHHPDVAGEGGNARMMRVNAAFERIERRRCAPSTTASRPPSGFAGQLGAGVRRHGGAGPAPGRPSGTVLGFGRHIGWSIGEIARVDPGYLAWLEDHRDGRPYLDEIDRTLRAVGFRREGDPKPDSGRRP
jgi:hypothetical protein